MAAYKGHVLYLIHVYRTAHEEAGSFSLLSSFKTLGTSRRYIGSLNSINDVEANRRTLGREAEFRDYGYVLEAAI